MSALRHLMAMVVAATVGLLLPIVSMAGFFDYHGPKFTYSGPDIEVKDMPLKVRDVPIHKDDSYALESNAGPVEKTQYDTIGTFLLGWSWYKERQQLRFNVSFDWIIYPTYWLYDNELRNYTNAPGTETRGYGAALTFVGIQKRGIIPDIESEFVYMILNIVPEIGVDLMLSEKGDSGFGFNLSYFRIQAVNGWDRYNSLEINKTYDLGHFMPVSVYGRYKWIEVGLVYPVALSKTSLGKEAEIQTKLTVLISLAGVW